MKCRLESKTSDTNQGSAVQDEDSRLRRC